MNTYSEFQVISSVKTEILQMSKFLHHDDDNDNAKAIAIPVELKMNESMNESMN